MPLHVQEIVENGHVRGPDGRLAIVNGEPPGLAGIAGAIIGDDARCPVYGMASISVLPGAGGVGPAVVYETSLDGGTTWSSNMMATPGIGALGTTGTLFTGVPSEGGLPAGSTHFRVRSTSAPGAMPVTLYPSAAPFRPNMSVTLAAGGAVALIASFARIGTISAYGLQNDETSTPLAGSGTFAGANRDLTVAASGSAPANVNYMFKEFRGASVSDVAGTLFLAVSPDNVTYRRVQSIPAVLVGAVYVAEFTYAPKFRYARVEYDNGAGGQAYFNVATARLAD